MSFRYKARPAIADVAVTHPEQDKYREGASKTHRYSADTYELKVKRDRYQNPCGRIGAEFIPLVFEDTSEVVR